MKGEIRISHDFDTLPEYGGSFWREGTSQLRILLDTHLLVLVAGRQSRRSTKKRLQSSGIPRIRYS